MAYLRSVYGQAATGRHQWASFVERVRGLARQRNLDLSQLPGQVNEVSGGRGFRPKTDDEACGFLQDCARYAVEHCRRVIRPEASWYTGVVQHLCSRHVVGRLLAADSPMKAEFQQTTDFWHRLAARHLLGCCSSISCQMSRFTR